MKELKERLFGNDVNISGSKVPSREEASTVLQAFIYYVFSNPQYNS
jgi:hypothetical protein